MSLIYELTAKNVAEIAIDDGKANVMSTDWFRELGRLLDRAEADEATAVLFRGRTGMFSAGLDMKWFPTLDVDDLSTLLEIFSATMLRVWGFPIPTVAAVTGHAVAGGCLLASACDHAVALAGPYRFQMNELLVGLPMPTWAATICQDAWPVPQVNDLLFLARPFSPEEALALGVVREVAESEEAVLESARAAATAMVLIDHTQFALSKHRLRSARVEHALSTVLEDFFQQR
jgi:enoyl-CoA hydratase